MSSDPITRWEDDIVPIVNSLKSSSVNVLIESLFKINALVKSKESNLDTKELDSILYSILSLYNRLNKDSKLHTLVLQCFSSFASLDSNKYTKTILAFISKLSTNQLAIPDLLVLIQWNMYTLSSICDQDLLKSVVKVIIASNANLVSTLSSYAQSELEGKKIKRHHVRAAEAAKAEIIRSFSTVLKSGLDVNFIITPLLDSKLPVSGILSHLGYLSTVTNQLSLNKRFRHIFQSFIELEPKVTTFFAKDMLATKVFPSELSLVDFGSYINNMMSENSFIQLVLPGLEKAALRNSELTFAIFAPSILSSINENKIDVLSAVVNSKFFPKIVTSLKATKDPVKVGSSNCLTILLSKFTSKSSGDDVVKILDETFKVLKATGPSAFEQKIMLAKILQASPLESIEGNKKIFDEILPIIQKDTNEMSLSELLVALLDRYIFSIVNDTPVKSNLNFTKALEEGLKNKKHNVRSTWATALSAAIIDTEFTESGRNQILDLFNNGVCDLLFEIFQDCAKAPLPSITNKLIGGGYASLAILYHLKATFGDDTLNNRIENFKMIDLALEETENQMSSYTNLKVVSKLMSLDSQLWFVRALYEISLTITESATKFGTSCMYVSLSRNVQPKARILANKLLEKTLVKNEVPISSSIVCAINEYVSFFNSSSIYTDYNFDLSYLSPFVSSLLTTKQNKANIELNLVNLLLPSHHCFFKGFANGWIGICQKAKLDPGHVIASNSSRIIKMLSDTLIDDNVNLFGAACSVVSTISFVSPEVIVPQLISILESDFSIIPDLEINDIKLKIWRGFEGEIVVDVLANSSAENIIRKGKDADDLKWENSVRKELEAKRKTVKKLTKDEQVKVNEQLKLESNIRAFINNQYLKLRRSLEIIIALSNQAATVDNGTDAWFPVAIEETLILLNNGNALALCSELATKCFLTMSKVINNSSLNHTSSMMFIGSSTLRLHHVDCVPPEFSGKPLNELLSSQLFSLKMASDKSQFNKLTLMYVLPLLVKIIENGKTYTLNNTKKIVKVNSEFNDEAPEEEQLTLALEILAVNGDLFEDATIPRTAIIENLLDLLALPTKAKIAKECFVVLCQNIALNVSQNDLQILLKNLISPVVFVRSTILEVLDEEFDLSDLNFNEELWISTFDNELNNSDVAQTIWSESKFELNSTVPERLIKYLGNEDNGIRLSISKALASSIIKLGSEQLFISMLERLLDFHREMALPPAPKTDEFGLPIKSANEKLDRWEQRSGVALSLKHLAPAFNSAKSVYSFFTFAVKERALGDKDEIVRSELQDAGMNIINLHGKNNAEILIDIFETALEEADEKSKIQDNVKESTIILYGNLARHLDEDDDRVENIVSRLLKALDTPSEDVQYAVSECIAPLVSFTEKNLSSYFENLFDKLFEGKTIAERRGAAYGIAGLVKGYGIKSLSEFDIIRNLTDASDDKKDFKKREGVSFALECLSQSLGPLFEPYILEILPILLKSFGDQSNEVREATTYAAKVFMKNTTSYGIKKMIPIAIANLEDYQWRSKKGSVELLGSMAYLDPTQLSSSLPEIVPNIVQVMKDTHKEVRKAADSSLKKFGEVIRNPEIQALVQDLLNAIGNPTKYTDVALEKLIKTQFAHYIDGPSLALIIHVIDRGMQDRSSIVKKRASQIIGNMAILVDSRDIMPYLAKLVEELQTAIVDPVDETRAIASRALGSLVEKLGEDKFPGLIDNLLSTLSDEERAGDRLGCAQALSEVIFGLGISKLEDMLPVILQGANSAKSFTREGYMPMLLYLPVCFGSQFSPYLNQTIPPILNGLADLNEDVRQISMKSGRLIVSNYAKKAVDLLLPELEKGLFDISPRIRQSSADLTGELLYKISGISGKQELSEDIARATNVSKALIDVLGIEKRNHVLASLFVCRSDTHGTVRNAAGDVWKALVANTPRTIKEILLTLTSIIVRRLASSNDEQRTIAAATLGDMVRRVGSNALSQLLPTLEESLVSSDSDAKQGICIAVKELIESSSDDNVIEYQDTFVKIIKEALVDANPSVRESAANAFDILQNRIGSEAVDEVVPQLLEQLNLGSEEALSALQEIMSTKSDVIFPILLPSLLSNPINAKAIGALSEVAGSALYKRLGPIINALVDGVINKSGNVSEIEEALVKSILSVDSDEGVHPLMQQLLSLMKHEDVMKRQVIYKALPAFFKETKLDYTIYTEDIVIQGIYNLNNKDTELAKCAFEMLSILVKNQRKEVLEKLIRPTQQTLSHIATDDEIYAFSLPRGPNCVLPIFIHGLMYGTSDQREISANGISCVIDKTPVTGLKPFVTGIVGPLIRVIGERYNGDVKSAILLALNKLFEKIPQLLRPFIPQLQRTFIKCLTDNSSELLRTRSAKALGTLIEYQPKVDPLVIELLNNFKNVEGDNEGVKSAILKALLEVIEKAGTKMSENCKGGVIDLIEREMGKNVNIVTYAELIGSLSRILSEAEFENMIRDKVLKSGNNQEFSILILNSFLKFSGKQVIELGISNEIITYLTELSNEKQLSISNNAVLAMGKMLLLLQDEEVISPLVIQLGHVVVAPESKSSDIRRLGLTIIRAISNENFHQCLLTLIPNVFTCVRDPVLPIKLAAEKALLALLDLVSGTERFDKWVSEQTGNELEVEGKKLQLRSITEYVKRIGTRLANQEKERLAAGGDNEAMYSDLYEEREEIWSVSV